MPSPTLGLPLAFFSSIIYERWNVANKWQSEMPKGGQKSRKWGKRSENGDEKMVNENEIYFLKRSMNIHWHEGNDMEEIEHTKHVKWKVENGKLSDHIGSFV